MNLRPSVAEVAGQVYGGLAEGDQIPDSGRQVAKLIPLFDVRPDPRQPRRIFPSQIAVPRDSSANHIANQVGNALQQWLSLAEQERGDGHVFPLMAYFDPPDGFEGLTNPGPIERRLIKLVKMAVDIFNLSSLTLPLKVVRDGPVFRIESGERRWLAYHLLHNFIDGEAYQGILAHVVDKPSVWRQASENGTREELNAIGKARELALLIMDIYEKQGRQFADYDEMVADGVCDRAYYAQVADGEQYRIPRSYGERIVGAMGLESVGQIRQYRALLRLKDELWTLADDQDLTEFEIRKLATHTVTHVTVSKLPPKPFVLKVGAQTVPKWEQVKARMPDRAESQILDTLVDFYLANQEGQA